MDTTTLQQVLARLQAIGVATLAPFSVYVDRTDAFSRDEVPALNILAQEGDVSPMAEMDVHAVDVELVFHVRADAGTNAAETMHRLMHGAIVADVALQALCEGRRLVGFAFDRGDADLPAMRKRARYRFTYMVDQTQL